MLASSQFASVCLAQSSPSPVLAIHAGGSAAGSFAADKDYSGGSPAGTSSAVDTGHVQNPAPQAVYQTQRYGPSTYTLPGFTPGAGYTVRLYFAEIYYGLSNPGGGGVGKREFNVSVNSQQVLTNFDIYAAAGHENIAVIKQFPVTADGSGNITIALSCGIVDQPEIAGIEVLAGAPAPTVSSIAVSPGSPIVHTGGSQQFTATASDQYGNPLASQPSFTWSVASGVGTISSAGLYSAGSAVGTAQVKASSSGVSGAATVSVSTGSIASSGTALSSGQTINLTALGTLDWTHWGLNGTQDKTTGEFDHKAASSGAPVGLISNYTGIGTGASSYTSSTVNFNWSDGTPTRSATNVAGVYVMGYNGISLTAPADTTPRTLTVFVGGYADYATLTAHLSDGSAADFTDSSFGYNLPGNMDGVNYQAAYTLTYQAASAGQTLTVTWTQTHSNASYAKAQLQAAALSAASSGTPALSRIAVSPANATVGTNTTQPFAATALDQNGNPLAPQPTFVWSVKSGVGTIISNGEYSSGSAAGTATVQAASGGVTGTATVTVRVPLAGLFPTGVDDSGNLLADGAADPHYSIASGPDGAGNPAHVTISTPNSSAGPLPYLWVANTNTSKWVSPQADQSVSQEPPGAYDYKTTFDLMGLDPSSVQISGQMVADDQVTDVRLNGVSLGLTAPYNTWTPISITSGFQAGVNTLEFLVTNSGSSNNPSGLQVQLTGTGNAAAPASTLASIAVSPPTATLNLNGTQQFTAVANDQNGNALSPQPAFTWSVANGGVGTIGSTTGLYSAGTASGSAAVQATSGSVTGTAAVTVNPAADFTVAASPNNFGIAPGGTASTIMTITPSSTFSGSVGLSVSGLPSGVTASFNPASPLTVAAGTPITSALTLTSSGATPTATFTVTASSGALTHQATLTLTTVPSAVTGLVDLYLDPVTNALTNKVVWNSSTGAGTFQYYFWTRNQAAPTSVGVGNKTTNNGADPFLIDNSGITYGAKNTYRAYVDYLTYYTVNGVTYAKQNDLLLLTCSATDMQSFATDNQAVDSRLDPRFSTNTFLDHQFGSTMYRGGLFAGYNSGPARVGRSLIKFGMPALPAGQGPWPVGSVLAYALRAYTPGTTTTVSCQRVSDTWVGPTVTWSLAPAMPSGVNGQSVIDNGTSPINTWIRWPLGMDIVAALTSNSGLLSVGLASTSENSSNWAYFAKKEYNPALTPFVLYSYGGFN